MPIALKKSALIVLSGGMDSAAALAYYHRLGYRTEAISFDYGQRHRVELAHAVKVAEQFFTPHRVVNLSTLRELFGASSQTDQRVPVPHGHYEDISMRKTVVPNRNMIMTSVAVAWAITRQLQNVVLGVHAGDHAVYPDCRAPFVEALAKTVEVCDYTPPRVVAPFLHMSKAEICTVGTLCGVDWSRTWSCYEGGLHHCGLCGTCTERKEAFKLAMVSDPTVYGEDHGPLGEIPF